MKGKRNCPICDSINSKLLMQVALKNFDEVKYPINACISECGNCGFVFNNNEINVELFNKFYTSGNFYFIESSFGTGGCDTKRYEEYYNILTPYLNRESIIVDVGCGKGQLVKYLIDKGFPNVRGVEPDKRMVEIAKSQGIPVYKGTASRLLLPANSVDLFIYTHVFEHLWDLDSAIEQAKTCLKSNGLIFIEVPNASNYTQARVFDFFWFSMPEHINHFSDYYLEKLMIKYGFEKVTMLENVVPYNNPIYGCPSLKMILRKNENMFDVFKDIEYNAKLKNEINAYITSEHEHLLKHKRMINEFKKNKYQLYIWGIGIEFFILSTFTDLLECNIAALIDKNPDKQRMTINGKAIVSPERLKQAESDSIVLLSSVFHRTEMEKYLNQISFRGKVIILDQ